MRRLLQVCLLLPLSAFAIDDARLQSLFGPLRIESAALSPDGKHVAFTLREGETISACTAAVDAPEHALAKAAVMNDSLAAFYRQPAFVNPPGNVTWLGWVSNERLAVLTNFRFLVVRGQRAGALYALNLDGGDARKLHDASGYSGQLRLRFLHPEHPDELVVTQDDVSHCVAASTGQKRKIDSRELLRLSQIDHHLQDTLRGRLNPVRDSLRQLLPTHEIDLIRNPRSDGNRVLALAQSVADPGGFLIYEPTSRRVWDFLRRSAANSAQRPLRTDAFKFLGFHPNQSHSGLLVYPVDRRIQRAPLVIWMSDQPGRAAPRTYRPEIQALAEFGFAVAVIDEPKVNRAPDAHRLLATHFADTIELLAQHYPVSRRSVALAGRRTGARRALDVALSSPLPYRAVALLLPQPDHYDELTQTMRFGAVEHVRENPAAGLPALFFCSWPGPQRVLQTGLAPRAPTPPTYPPHRAAEIAVADLRDLGATAVLRKESDDFQAGRPPAVAATFRTIEAFFNEHLYRYSVSLGELEVIETTPIKR